jgi:SAM-dependent methyltransferase
VPFESPYVNGYGLRFPESQIISATYQFLNLASHPKNRIRILDVGCGLGNHALLLETIDAEYVGIDLDPVAIERAKQIFAHKSYADKITFKNANLTDFSLTKDYAKSFTLIIDRASLQHNSTSDLCFEGGIFSKVASGLDPEKGIFISYWASRTNNFDSMSQRFPIFTGFEDISKNATTFLKPIFQKRIVEQATLNFETKETFEIVTNFISVWKANFK